MKDAIGIGMLGFGGVNQALVQLLARHNRDHADLQFRIVGVSDLRWGSAHDSAGLSFEALEQVCQTESDLKALGQGGAAEPNNDAIIALDGCDIIAEATFSNMKNGQPALSLCEAALTAGKHVVTTNKGVVAFGGDRLSALADQRDLGFAYEGAVMSGTPVLCWARTALQGAKIQRLRGVLNGTSNFILGQLEAGIGFEDALTEARKRGYAEADSSSDVEGFDVRAKVIVLALAVLGEKLGKADIACDGISGMTPEECVRAKALNKRWKLIADIRREETGQVEAYVRPQLVAPDDPFYNLNGPTNALEITTETLGPIMIFGPGAGREETAYALYSDILRLSHARMARA